MLPVVVRGSLWDVSGYSSFTRLVARALWLAGCAPRVLSSGGGLFSRYMPSDENERELLEEMSSGPSPDVATSVVISVSPASHFNFCYGVSVGYSMIEATRISADWAECCNRSDIVWVPGPFCKRSFEDSGVDEAVVMAPGFDTETYRPKPTDRHGVWEGMDLPFYFAMCGHLFSDIEDRKGIRQLVRCFVREFHGDPGVGLLLKTQMLDHSFVDRIELLNALGGILGSEGHPETMERIHVVHRNQTSDELATMYSHPSVKAFATCTGGEGVGLFLLEAASCGLHIIGTGWSEHVNYLPKECFTPLPYELIELPDEFVNEKTKVYVRGSKWAHVMDADLMRAMRSFYEKNVSKPKDGTSPDFSSMSLDAFGRRMKAAIETFEVPKRLVAVPEKIQIASGIYPEKGYFHVDLDPMNSAKVDLLCDGNALPFARETVKRVLVSHLLEHLSDVEAAKLLYNVWRLLIPGGELEIRVPDIDVAFGMWDEFDGDPPPPHVDRIKKMVFGSLDPHVNLWGHARLEAFLRRMGFEGIERLNAMDTYDELAEAGINDGKARTFSLKVLARKKGGAALT